MDPSHPRSIIWNLIAVTPINSSLTPIDRLTSLLSIRFAGAVLVLQAQAQERHQGGAAQRWGAALEARLESAWFQRSKLKYDKLLLSVALSLSLRPYTAGTCRSTRRTTTARPPSPAPSWVGTPFTALCTFARHVIHHVVYRCSPRHPPHGVPMIATSPPTLCAGARNAVHHIVYRCSPRYSPHIVPVLTFQPMTWRVLFTWPSAWVWRRTTWGATT